MRALVPKALAILALLGLAACVLPQGGAGEGKAKGPNPVTGDAIEVTALDDISPAARPKQESPASEAPDDPGRTAGPQTPRPKARPDAGSVEPQAAQAKPAPAEEAAVSEVAAPEAAPAEPGIAKSEAQKACEKRGDLWAKLPGSQAQTCVKRTRDAGKSCSTSKECDGECLARSRTCAPYKPLFGCNEILQEDGRRMTLCLD